MYAFQEVIAMLASTPPMDMTLPNLTFSFLIKSVRQVAAPSQPASDDSGDRSSTPLADTQPLEHIDVKA